MDHFIFKVLTFELPFFAVPIEKQNAFEYTISSNKSGGIRLLSSVKNYILFELFEGGLGIQKKLSECIPNINFNLN